MMTWWKLVFHHLHNVLYGNMVCLWTLRRLDLETKMIYYGIKIIINLFSFKKRVQENILYHLEKN
jgi:hypothetical protein